MCLIWPENVISAKNGGFRREWWFHRRFFSVLPVDTLNSEKLKKNRLLSLKLRLIWRLQIFYIQNFTSPPLVSQSGKS